MTLRGRGHPTAALAILVAFLCASCSKAEESPAAGAATTGTASDPAAAGASKTKSQGNSAIGGTLVINTNASDPAPKAGFDDLIAKFQTAHPEVKVKLNVFDHESFKTSVRNFLTSQAPDVITWYAGNRMRTFVDRKLLDDVSDLWQKHDLDKKMAPSLAAMTVNGKQYGIPYTYYQWGVYYRRDIFDQHGIQVPKTWDEFLAACKTLKDKGIAPIAIGTKFLWTAAGWFDYLNLRINGYQFHMDLMNGKVPYTDDRVKKVFDTWRPLIDAGYYVDNHATYSWQEAQAFFIQGKAAMYLIGNFLIANLPDDVVSKSGYFQFPTIDPAVAMFEDAPIDTLHIPAKAENKAAARAFLAFAAQAEIQSALNIRLSQLPPHIDAEIKDDPFLQQGDNVIKTASGLAQFYDRDTDPEMAKLGMKGFQEFMVKPDRRDAILERLDKARQRIFK